MIAALQRVLSTARDYLPREVQLVPRVRVGDEPYFRWGRHELPFTREYRYYLKVGSWLAEYFIGPRQRRPGVFSEDPEA